VRLRSIILSAFAMALCGSLEAQVYKTEPLTDEVHTLRRVVDGDFMQLPILDLQSARGEGDSRIEVSFDYIDDISDEYPWINYTIVHCDAQWKQDDLSELDYLNGFMPARMESPEPSFNTVTATYYHYEVSFPNEDVQLQISGNYAVLFSTQAEPDKVIATATFSVSEQKAFVKGEVTGNTDIDFRQRHQQLNLNVSWSAQQMKHLNPSEELTLVVRQNRREETRRVVKQPLRIEQNAAIYEHNHDLIFEGGNNWRQFENNDERYPGIRVDRLKFSHNGYDVWLMTDKCRANREFYTEPDVKGRYIVHAVKVDDPDTEAEYSWVHFSLDASPAYEQKGVYLIGDFANSNNRDSYRMRYDDGLGLYVADVYLKQGAYNYQYSLPAIEGNFYETPNEYDVFVYYRPFGARYDHLLGTAVIQ